MKNKNISVTRIPQAWDDRSTYGFPELWDSKNVRTALANASENHSMPGFYLSKLEIHPSGCCNLRCKFCYGRNLAPQEKTILPKERIFEVFQDLRGMVGNEIKENPSREEPLVILAGLYSEPLTHPEIREIIENLGKYNFRLGLYTNGLLMNDELSRTIVKCANDSNSPKPSYVSFNISSALTGNSYGVLLEKIKAINGMRRDTSNLEINAPIIATNGKRDYVFLKKLTDDLILAGTDIVRLSLPWGEKAEEEYLKTFEKLKDENPGKIRIRYPEEQTQSEKCFAMSMSLSISPEGDVYPCPEKSSPIFRERFSYGNVLEKRISEIWQGKEHENIFRKLNPVKENCTCCPVYGKFNRFCKTY